MKFDLTRQNFVQSLLTTILLLIIFGGKMLFLWEELNSAEIITTELSSTPFLPPATAILSLLYNHKIVSAIVLPLLLLFNTLYIYRITVVGGTYNRTGNFVSSINMLLLATLPSIPLSIIGNIIALLILLSTEQIGRVRNLVNCSNIFFTSSLYIGIAILLSAQSLLFIIPIITMLFVGQRFVIKELISSILALFTPLALYLYVMWIINDNILADIETVTAVFNSISLPKFNTTNLWDIAYLTATVVATITAIFGVISINNYRYEMRSRSYHTYVHYFSLFFTAILAVVLFGNNLVVMLPTLFIPLSLLTAYFIHNRANRTVRNIVYILFATISIISAFVQ